MSSRVAMAAIVKYLTPTDGSEDDPRFAGKIRMTPDGRISIFDTLACFGFKNPRDIWSKLQKAHSEVVSVSDNWKFPGPGQRDTPVTDCQGLTKIIMLLPGKLAAKFRDGISILLERYLNADRSLAEDILKRADAKDGVLANLNEHPRIQSSHTTKELNATIKEYMDKNKGCGMLYPRVHDTNNVTVTGKTTAQLREVYRASGSTRDANTRGQSLAMAYIQWRETERIRKTGDNPVAVSKETGGIFSAIFKADGLHADVADAECVKDNKKVMRLKQMEERDAKRIRQ